MRTLVSFRALSLGFATTVGLGCGGNAFSGDQTGTGGTGTGTGGTGTGSASTGGGTSTGGINAGGLSSGGSGSLFPCVNPTPVVDAEGRPSSVEYCETGGSHRVGPVDCLVAVPRSGVGCTTSGLGTDECLSDANCTAGPYGYCSQVPQIGTCGCNYGCHTDADCGETSVCVCGNPVGYCVAATCASDADCGAGLECRSFQDPTANLCYWTRFECQTPSDECSGDTDCAPGGTCVADVSGVHRCQTFPCAVPGRPFLVDGVAVTAQPCERSDWTAALAPVDDTGCGALADHWTSAGLLEHASVAAFARFTLQLLQLGAPADLIEGAERAMADEILHARLCFAQATRYRGKPVGPSPLPTEGCLQASDFESVVRMVVREGCIGETVAAVEAAEALAHSSDPRTRAALAIITRDETRHAELAWEFIRWAITIRPETVDILLDELAAALGAGQSAAGGDRAGTYSGETRDAEPSAMELAHAAHGLLPEPHLRHLRERALREIIAPLGRALADRLHARRAA
jgi:hypothetical protein